MEPSSLTHVHANHGCWQLHESGEGGGSLSLWHCLTVEPYAAPTTTKKEPQTRIAPGHRTIADTVGRSCIDEERLNKRGRCIRDTCRVHRTSRGAAVGCFKERRKGKRLSRAAEGGGADADSSFTSRCGERNGSPSGRTPSPFRSSDPRRRRIGRRKGGGGREGEPQSIVRPHTRARANAG